MTIRNPSEDKKTSFIFMGLGIIPVVWAALVVAPFLSEGLAGIIEGFTSGMNNPMAVKWCDDSLKTVLIFLLIYGIGMGVYFSTRRNYRKGEEHGSAKWGNAGHLVGKYADKNKQQNKEILGDEYCEYNLVLALPNGRPLEGQIISRSFKALIREHGLPDVVFHSLRHTSTTYKLKLNKGDMKAVQGDTGHAQIKMVSDVYSHILDEDRRNNATKFEEAFYTPNESKTEKADTPASAETAKVMELLNNAPELASQLLQLLTTATTKTVCAASDN